MAPTRVVFPTCRAPLTATTGVSDRAASTVAVTARGMMAIGRILPLFRPTLGCRSVSGRAADSSQGVRRIRPDHPAPSGLELWRPPRMSRRIAGHVRARGRTGVGAGSAAPELVEGGGGSGGDGGVDAGCASERFVGAGQHGDGVGFAVGVGDDGDLVAYPAEQRAALGGQVPAVWHGESEAAGDLPGHDVEEGGARSRAGGGALADGGKEAGCVAGGGAGGACRVEGAAVVDAVLVGGGSLGSRAQVAALRGKELVVVSWPR